MIGSVGLTLNQINLNIIDVNKTNNKKKMMLSTIGINNKLINKSNKN